MSLIKNETIFSGETYLAFEKYPHEEHPDHLNKVILNLGFVKLVSRVKAVGYNIDFLEHICNIVDVKIITKWVGSSGSIVAISSGADEHSYAGKFKPVLICRTRANKDIAPETVYEAYKRNCISSHSPYIFLKLKRPYHFYIDADAKYWWYTIPTEDYAGVWMNYLGHKSEFNIGDMRFNPLYKEEQPIETIRDAIAAAEIYIKDIKENGSFTNPI